MQSEPLLKRSAQAFLRWGGQHAQFLGVIGVITGGLVLGGTKIQHWRDEARTTRRELEAKIEVLEGRISLARAEASKETAERFLLFGYADEYARYQQKALGDKAPRDSST